MATTAAVLSAFFTAIIAILTYRTTREMRLATDESGRAAINIMVVRGRRPDAKRQNIHLVIRNDGKFPAYNVKLKFTSPHQGVRQHIIGVLDPGCYDTFMFDAANGHFEVTDHLQKSGVRMSYTTHAGSKVERAVRPVAIGVDLNRDDGDESLGWLIEPNPSSLKFDVDSF